MATERIRRFVAAFLMMALAVPLLAQPAGPRIGPRDVVTVSVFNVEQLSGKFPVDVDGSMNFPLLGTLPVAGMTTRELEIDLAERLVSGGFFTKPPQITVELSQNPNKRVTVTGAVRNPGLLQYAGEITVLEALVRAGNATSEAGNTVLIVRGATRDPAASPDAAVEDGNQVITVNLSELQGGDVAAHNVTLEDGDLIIVQRALSVYISGYVRSPGAYRVESGTTVLQALALAGGVTERGTTRGIRILRNKEYVKDVTLDTVVEPGDTIMVRASLF